MKVTMEEKNIINKVAYGLTMMKKKPDYFLFLQFLAEDWTWDEETILGIPVFHTTELLYYQDEIDCPFLPIWKKEGDYILDVVGFRRGYDEYLV